MTLDSMIPVLLLITVLAPLCGFAVIALFAIGRERSSEPFIRFVTKASYRISLCGLFALLAALLAQPEHSMTVRLQPWFSFIGSNFELSFLLDPLSVGFLALTLILTNLIGDFSESYIHREPGYERFSLLFLLAAFGMILIVTGDHLGMILIGWEFLGISSALLIAFFSVRAAPVKHGLLVFIVYRIADLGLILSLFYAHSHFGHVSFSHLFQEPIAPSATVTVLGCLLLFSALGKSSLLPFIPWLPRAMEGPTPSSALFYGAFAVHAGPYLLLRCAPIVDASLALSTALVLLGLLSALFSSLLGRIRSDVKTSLAYASMTQIALIYMEIGLHWYWVAAIHTAGHMCLRTYQFLRAPSALHDIHVREKLGIGLAERHSFFDRFLSRSSQSWLYRLAFEEGGVHALYYRYLINPFLNTGRRLAAWERRSEEELEQLFEQERTP